MTKKLLIKRSEPKRSKNSFLIFRVAAIVVIVGVFAVFGFAVKNTLALSWSEPATNPPDLTGINGPVWAQTAASQTGGLWVTGKGRFDTAGTGDANCTGAKLCGVDNAAVIGLSGESATGVGLYASSGSASSYAGAFNGNVYLYPTYKLGVGVAPSYPVDVVGNVNSSTGFCIAGSCINAWPSTGGYWSPSGANIISNVAGNVLVPQAYAFGFANGQTIRDNGGGGLAINVPSFRLQLYAGTDATNGVMDFYTNALERMTIINNGNVGIGTTAPWSTLDVRSGTVTAPILNIYSTVSSYTAGLVEGTLAFGSNGSSNNIPVAYINGLNEANADSSKGALSFSTRAGTVTEKVRITSGGNVGIGTTTPGYKLTVGAGGASAIAAGNLLISAAQPGGTVISARDTTNSVETAIGTDVVAGAYGWAGTVTNQPFRIKANNADAVTVLTSGAVGIGTTAPSVPLDVVSAIEGGIKIESAVAPRFDLTDLNGNAGARNWMLRTDTAVFGDLSIAQSNAKNGDPLAAGTSRFYIKNDGTVGIANTAPAALLTLGTAGTKAGTLSLAGATSGVLTIDTLAAAGTWALTLPPNGGSAGQYLQTDGAGNATWQTVSSSGITCGGTCSSGYHAKFLSASTVGNGAIYDTGSFVGINTASPSHALHVNSSAGQDGIIVNATTYPEMVLQTAGTTRAYLAIAGGAGGYGSGTLANSLIVRSEGPAIHFVTNAGTVAMTVNTSNVGIGTTTPNNRIQVAGLINFDPSYLNTYLGASVGIYNTSGAYNVGVGTSALNANSTGSYNAAVGQGALSSNTSGSSNAAFGYGTLMMNSTGSYNTAVGFNALDSNTASGNSAFGYNSLRSNTNGYQNTALGYTTLFSNSSGSSNVAAGTSALYYNTSGSNNTAYGYESLFANSTGSGNTATGYLTLETNASGGTNTADGYYSLYNTTGSGNTAVGSFAGYTASSGSNNTFLGASADTSNGGFSNSTAVGSGAYITASNQIVLGNSSVSNITFPYSNPTLSSSSYFIIPGGAYFNSGTVYFQNTAQFRNGIQDDSGTLNILGGSSNNLTYFPGMIQVGSNIAGMSNGDISVSRGNGTGVVYMGTGSHYLYFDGTNYEMPNGSLIIGPSASDNLGAGGDIAVARVNNPSTGVIFFGNTATHYLYFNGANYYLNAGNLYVSGQYYYSDGRLKDNITSLGDDQGLDIINRLNPVTYNWKDKSLGTAKQYGFVAQDVEKILPDLVSSDKDGKLSLNYVGLIAPVVKSIQEQQKAITNETSSQTLENQALEAKNKEQQDEIDILKKQIEALTTK
jgi:hypothetical protein